MFDGKQCAEKVFSVASNLLEKLSVRLIIVVVVEFREFTNRVHERRDFVCKRRIEGSQNNVNPSFPCRFVEMTKNVSRNLALSSTSCDRKNEFFVNCVTDFDICKEALEYNINKILRLLFGVAVVVVNLIIRKVHTSLEYLQQHGNSLFREKITLVYGHNVQSVS
jgi:ribosomal protein L23